MKKRILATITLVIVLLSMPVFAEAFVTLGECPITALEEGEKGIWLDKYENEIYGNAVQLSEDEWYDIMYSGEKNPLIPFSEGAWGDAPTPYNDGLKYGTATGYHELYGDDQVWAEYTDINDKSILSELPGGWSRTWDYVTHYNFGFFTEAAYEMFMPEYAQYFEDGYYFSESIITNALTGKRYYINGACIQCIDNNGNVYFSVTKMSGGDCVEKYYKAQLKKTALVTVFYNGEKIGFDQVPVIEEGRTLVPLRAIFEKIGASVEWNSDTKTVTAKKGDTTVKLTIDSTKATKNGETVKLDVPAKIVGGRTLVPVRFVSDCFGVDVQWDAKMQKVILESK